MNTKAKPAAGRETPEREEPKPVKLFLVDGRGTTELEWTKDVRKKIGIREVFVEDMEAGDEFYGMHKGGSFTAYLVNLPSRIPRVICPTCGGKGNIEAKKP